MNTVRVILAFAGGEDVDVDKIAKVISSLRNYIRPEPEEPLAPAALQKAQKHG